MVKSLGRVDLENGQLIEYKRISYQDKIKQCVEVIGIGSDVNDVAPELVAWTDSSKGLLSIMTDNGSRMTAFDGFGNLTSFSAGVNISDQNLIIGGSFWITRNDAGETHTVYCDEWVTDSRMVLLNTSDVDKLKEELGISVELNQEGVVVVERDELVLEMLLESRSVQVMSSKGVERVELDKKFNIFKLRGLLFEQPREIKDAREISLEITKLKNQVFSPCRLQEFVISTWEENLKTVH